MGKTKLSIYEQQAFDYANKGILSGSEGEFALSVEYWEKAAGIAKNHFAENDLYYWIYGGYGSALYDSQRYQECITVTKISLPWTLSIKQPISSLTLSRAYLMLNEKENAIPHLQEVYLLIDDEIYQQIYMISKAELSEIIEGF